MIETVQWGWAHSFQHYLLMFDLKESELEEGIVDVASGASSFAAELRARAYHAVSIDPIYKLTAKEMPDFIEKMLLKLGKRLEKQKITFVWAQTNDLSELMGKQRGIADVFLKDYLQRHAALYYIPQALPTIQLKKKYGLALCANFLFDGPFEDDFTFQVEALKNMCSIAKEARIFPLINSAGQNATHLAPLMAALQAQGYGIEIREVPFLLQDNANAMLRVWSRQCQLESVA